jgi:hypothetical protein
MLLSRSHKFIFVHIAKTAGSSIEHALKQYSDVTIELRNNDTWQEGKHLSIKQIEEKFTLNLDRFFKFTIVRHPVSRVFSFYNFIKARFGKDHVNDLDPAQVKIYNALSDLSFSEWIESGAWETVSSLRKNQVDYITNSEGKIIMDFTGRIENLENDFKAILDKLNLKEIELGKLNVIQSESSNMELTNAAKEILHDFYKVDFAKLKYSINEII